MSLGSHLRTIDAMTKQKQVCFRDRLVDCYGNPHLVNDEPVSMGDLVIHILENSKSINLNEIVIIGSLLYKIKDSTLNDNPVSILQKEEDLVIKFITQSNLPIGIKVSIIKAFE